MEKLLELLNEYSPLKDMSDEYCVKDWKVYVRTRLYAEPDVYENYTLRVISKKFWFIKWLRSHDRIRDFGPLEQLVNGYWRFQEYESRLMLLSIQDEPIEFLISILK